MSNCILIIGNKKLHFSKKDFHVDAYLKVFENMKKNMKTGISSFDLNFEEHFAYWFLDPIPEITNDEFVFSFEKGNSSHTARDFVETLNYLAIFIKEKNYKQKIQIKDIENDSWWNEELNRSKYKPENFEKKTITRSKTVYNINI